MADGNNGWKTTQDEFRGYMKRATEDIMVALDRMEGKLEDHDERIDEVEEDVTRIKTITGVVAAFFGIIGGTIISWIFKLWGRQ